MTIPEVKQLIESVSTHSKESIRGIASSLPIFDACNFVVWLEKMKGIKIGI